MDEAEKKIIQAKEEEEAKKEVLNEPIYTGDKLKDAVENCLDERVPLVEGFIYENNIVQVFADDGKGKSTAILNAVVEMSAGLNVWKGLRVPKPLRIIWLSAERPLVEPFERIKTMSQEIKPNWGNLVFDKKIQDFDIKRKEEQACVFLRIAELATAWDDFKFDLIVIDPIYAIVSGGMTSDADVHLINHFLRKIQNRFNCSILYLHHTNRGSRSDKGSRTEGDMYGSRFLSANLTGQYHLKTEEDGVQLYCTKNTYGNLIGRIPLVYNEIYKTLSVSRDSADYGKGDRIMIFLRNKRNKSEKFMLREIANSLKVSDAYIRKVMSPLIQNGTVKNVADCGQKGIYSVERDI